MIYLVVSPFVFLIWTSVWSSFPGDLQGTLTVDNYVSAYTDPILVELVLNSTMVAVGTTSLALVLGFTFAWLFARTNLPTKGYLELVIIAPYAVPGFIYALSYIFTFGPNVGIVNNIFMDQLGFSKPIVNVYSLEAIIVVLGINMATSTYLLLVPALQNLDPALEESGRIHGASLFWTLREITFPVILPAVMSAFIITFVRGLGEFAVVAFLGIPQGFHVYATRIWAAINQTAPPLYGYASALSLSLLLITGILVWYYRKITSRREDYMTVTGQGYQPRQWDLGKWRWPIAGSIWLVVSVFWILPMLVMTVASFHSIWGSGVLIEFGKLSLEHYKRIFTSPEVHNAFANSLIISLIGSAIGTVIIVLTAYYTERTDYPFRGIVDFLSLTPLAIPGIILGASVLFTYLWLGEFVPALNIYGTIWIIMIGSIIIFIPTATRMAVGSIVQIHTELEESARVLGATWTEQMREVFLPLFKNTIAIIYLYFFMHIFRLLSVQIMTYSRGSETIPVIIFRAWQGRAELEFVSAISVVFISMMVVILIVFRRMGVTFYEL